jgi:hypothetical protein
MTSFRITCLLLLTLLSSCSWNPKITLPEKADKNFEQFFTLLREKKFDAIAERFDPKEDTALIKSECQKMATPIPDGVPLSAKVVEFRFNIFKPFDGGDAKSSYNITKEYEFPSTWIVLNLSYAETGDSLTYTGMRLYSFNSSLAEQNRFELQGKSPIAYAVLLLAIIVPLFIIYSLVKCVRTPIKRKWLWLIFILLGFGTFQVNWSTGAFSFNPFFIQLFGAAASRMLYGPWIIGVSVPVGAIVFLLKSRKLKSASETPPIP